jgi:hypothetical protein
VAPGGLEMRDGYTSRAHRRRARERTGKRERKGRCLGGSWEWCELSGEIQGAFYRPKWWGAGVASVGAGMVSAWRSPACFRGHSGSGAAWACPAVLW